MSARLVSDILARLARDGGTVRVDLFDGTTPRRWRVAAFRDGLVTFERTDHRGNVCKLTRRVSLGRIAG